MERVKLFEDKYIGYHTFGLGLNNVVDNDQESEDNQSSSEDNSGGTPQVNPNIDTGQSVTP